MSKTYSPDGLAPAAIAALRVIAGLLLIEHALVKLIGFPAGAQPGMQPLTSLFGVGGLIELTTGALIVAGLFTRPAAFVASGLTAVAYFMFHAPTGFFPVLNGGEPAILFSFIFLTLVATGPGAFSLEAALRRSAPRTAAA